MYESSLNEKNRLMRFLGTFFAISVFLWRYVNVPENWTFVANPWSIFFVSAWFLGDLLYPFVFGYVRACKLKES